VRTDELIVQLARAAGPVRPLPGPSVRLARWTAAAVPLAALGVIVIGPRKDILTAIYQPTFVWLAMATLGTALLSAMGCNKRTDSPAASKPDAATPATEEAQPEAVSET